MGKKVAEPEQPATGYKIISEEHYPEGDIWHIKLGTPAIVRLLDDPFAEIQFAEAEYVTVCASTWKGKDENGPFTYSESTVVAADADGNDERAKLYFSNVRLELWQIMFAIGQV